MFKKLFCKLYNFVLGSFPEFQALKKEYRRVLLENQELERKATHDYLTDLYNRRYVLEVFEMEVLRAARFSEEVSVMIIDVDHFKLVNDTYGHNIGDAVLCNISAALQESMREIDVLGRYGGEEFIVICPNTDSIGARVLADRIRKNIEDLVINTCPTELSVTVSVGFSSAVPKQIIEDVEGYISMFIDEADKAVYTAKSSGRNCVKSYDDYFASMK